MAKVEQAAPDQAPEKAQGPIGAQDQAAPQAENAETKPIRKEDPPITVVSKLNFFDEKGQRYRPGTPFQRPADFKLPKHMRLYDAERDKKKSDKPTEFALSEFNSQKGSPLAPPGSIDVY
jgi:hypothetical protein